jgi:hypothetical protein
MAKSIIVGAANTASASGTFLHVGGGAAASTEIQTEYAVTHDCVFSSLRRNIPTGGSGTNTCQFRKNGSNGSLVATGTGTGAAADTTHTDSLVAGDVFSLAITDDGTDPLYRHVSMNVEFDTGTGTFFRNSSGSAQVFDVASATRFIPIAGGLQTDGTATEANAQFKIRGYSLVDAFQVRVDSNARVTDTIFKLRINGSDVAASSITVGAGVTGLFMVTGINQALADGDLICAAIVTDTGVEDLTLNFIGATLLSSAGATELWTGNVNGVARTASATPDYYVPGGTLFSRATTTGTDIITGFAADCTGLRLFVSANTYTGAATLKLFVNNVDSGFTTTINAGATGWIENTTDTETILATDEICWEIVGGTSGSMTVTAIGMTLEQPAEQDPSVEPSKPRPSGGGGMGIGRRNRNFVWPSFSTVNMD